MKLSYAQKLYYKSIGKLLIFPILAMLCGVLLLIFSARELVNLVSGTALVTFGLGFMSFPLFFGAQKFLDKHVEPKLDHMYDKFSESIEKDRDSAKLGMDGEKIVGGWLSEIIPREGWNILPNIKRKNSNGQKYDIDTVVVGPKGVFVFEIKNSSYNYFFTTEDCAVVVGNQIRPFSGTDPRLQVGRNAETLEKLLKENNLPDIRTKRAVIFARSDSFRFLGSPAVYLIDNKETLRKFIMEFPDDPEFNFERCKKIADSLK